MSTFIDKSTKVDILICAKRYKNMNIRKTISNSKNNICLNKTSLQSFI